MDLAATQVYEDEDAVFSQENSHASEEQSEQVGTLRINSIDYRIKKGITKIGRCSSCDIIIHNMAVSRLHAEIEAGGGKRSTWICHLNLKNWTKLNNLTLQPNRSYELKDGSVIEFGCVRAIYHTYCPADDIMIPETPAPQQKTVRTIIPNTPDSSLNNSSSDGSIIFGTQKDDESSVFRRPRIPPESPSASTSKKSAFTNKSNDSHAVTLHMSDSQVSIHDIETQKFDEGYNTASDSIYDVQKETQGDSTDVSKCIVKANASKEFPKLNVYNKTSGGSVSDIHDIETQNCIDDITEMETQKNRIDICSVAEKEFTTEVYTMETQAHVNDTEGGNNAQKTKIGKAISKKKSLGKIGRDIHDLDTQRLDDKYVAEDIANWETQLVLDNVARCENRDISDMETQLEANSTADETDNRVNKDNSRKKSLDKIGHNVHDLDTQRFDKYIAEDIADLETQVELGSVARCENRDISDMETQLEANSTTNEIIDNRVNKDNRRKKSLDKIGHNIHDLDTQRFDDKYIAEDIADLETQVELSSVARCENRDISDMETQLEANSTANEIIDNRVNKDNRRKKSLDKVGHNIHDLDTQRFDDKYIAEDIADLETQVELSSVARCENRDISDMETQLEANSTANEIIDNRVNKDNRRKKSLDKIGHNIHDLDTQRFDDKYIAEDIADLETQVELGSVARCEQNRDISDMETQLVANDTTNETTDNRVNKDQDKNVTGNDKINHENVTNSFKSRSSSPRSLNLSSPGVDGDCPSPLDESCHLLESSDLLEFFTAGIDRQDEAGTSNMSTPKPLTKVSSKKINVENVRNVANDEEDNDEDIFNAPTQSARCKFEALLSDDSETNEEDALVMGKVPKKKLGVPQSKRIDDDSETDAEEYVVELAKKQSKSSRTLKEPSNEDVSNRNDPGTSIESEDMFDVQTQPLDGHKDTINSLINQPQKTNEVNEAEVDNTVLTKIISNVDQNNRTSTFTLDINDTATQLVLPCKTSSKTTINFRDFVSKNNQNDTDDVANTHIIINANSIDCCTTENLDSENIDYELTPTQIIGKIEDKEKRKPTCERGSSEINDTLEQKLTEMFADLDNDMNSIREPSRMSTQENLENILESSEYDEAANTSADRDTGNIPQNRIGIKNHTSCNEKNLPDTKINANNMDKAESDSDVNFSTTTMRKKRILKITSELVETDSQSSDVYFSTITTRRKKNILKDTPELTDPVENTASSRQDVHAPQASEINNKKTTDDNVTMESDKERKKISKTKNKSDAVTEVLNDNNMNNAISNENNERRSRNDLADAIKSNVDNAEENASICIPCPSHHGQRAQTSDTLYESDDDILVRLPAVRISGTLSNPASPSASSTSTVRSMRSKRNVVKSKGKKDTDISKEKSLRKQNIRNNEQSVDDHSNSVLGTLTAVNISSLIDTSDDSDNETKYKRFRQMAGRMLGNKFDYLNQQNRENRKGACVSPGSKCTKNTDIEVKNPMRISSRTTRHSNKQSNQSSQDADKEACVNDTAYTATISTESETKSTTVAKRKTSLNVTEESVQQLASKKRKTAEVTEECPVSTRSRRSTMKTAIIDRQSPNNLEHFTKTSSRESSSENVKSFEDSKAVSKTTQVTKERPVFTRSRRNTMKTATDRQSPNLLENITKIRSRESSSENVKSSEDSKTVSKTTQVIEEHPVFTRSQRNTIKTATDRQSPNLLENITKTRSHESSSENVKSSEDSKTVSKTTQVIEEHPVFTRSRRNTMKTAADRQSPNLLEHITKTRSQSSSENVKSSEDNKAVSKTTLGETQEISLHTRIDGNVDSGRVNVKRTRRMIYNSRVTTHVNDVTVNENGKDKPVQTKETDTQASQSQNKVLRVMLSPIKNISNDDSQEVERIMARGPSNTQDKNLSIRESSKAKIFKRELRNRSKKQDTSDSETGSTLTESSTSSEIEDSDNTQLDNSGPKSKRQKSGESFASLLLDARVVIKKETFKRPIRVKENSLNSVFDSSIEKVTGESSTESDTSTSFRVSRSKTANTRKKKMESNKDSLTDKSASTLDISAEVTSFAATPSRARRNTSSLSNSTPSAMRHKILFTGITEDYSKIVKTLGGSKVEDTANCTVLVTDKVRRTYKFLCALAKGIPIVAIDWLRDSKTTGQFLDWENYILKDPAAEAKFAFRLRKSLDKAKEKKLLDRWTVVLTPGVAPPPIDELKEIVSSCGGKALVRPPAKWPERAMVLSREEDLPNARKFLAKAPKTVTVQSTEFILTGILRQETDFVKYKLM